MLRIQCIKKPQVKNQNMEIAPSKTWQWIKSLREKKNKIKGIFFPQKATI